MNKPYQLYILAENKGILRGDIFFKNVSGITLDLSDEKR